MEADYRTIIDLLDELEDIVLEGSRVPFRSGKLINDQDVIQLIDLLRTKLPKEINQSHEIILRTRQFIEERKQIAQEIIKTAELQRNEMVSSIGIQQEANRQILKMKSDTKKMCDSLIDSTQKESARIQANLAKERIDLKEKYLRLNKFLKTQATEKKRELDEEYLRNKEAYINRNKALIYNGLKELESIKQESIRIKKEAEAESNRIKNETKKLMLITQQRCKSKYTNTEHQVASLQICMNDYADKSLSEIENNLKKLLNQVNASRQEIISNRNKKNNHKVNKMNSKADNLSDAA